MKVLFFIVVGIFSLFQPSVSRGDALTESDKEFELEVERVDMRELTDQTAAAVDEAQHQEQLERQHRQDLQELRSKKASLSKKAKARMAEAEYRRQKAERAVAKYDVEIKHLKKQIAALEGAISQRQADVEDAEAMAAEEKSEINEYRQERKELLKKLRHKRAPAAVHKTNNDDLEAFHDVLPDGEEF